MLDVRLKMLENDRLRRSCAPSTSSINNLTSHIPHSALTLIELLVVIVILTTLVGGVIPLLSPNNDERKIQVASRGLQGYIVQAQAQAARTGRPQGIAFRESSAGSGVALEVFGLEVPPPFAGFSTESRVEIANLALISSGTVFYYGPNTTTQNGGTQFPEYNTEVLYQLQFILADGLSSPDLFPPRTFRIGDVIDVEGNQFLIVDDKDPNLYPNLIKAYPDISPAPVPDTRLRFLEPDLVSATPAPTVCVWINNSGQALAPGLKRYQISRQPTNSSESPYQMPAGIVIDMQASVTEGNGNAVTRFPTAQSLYVRPTLRSNPTDSVGIMFSPTGAVDRVIFNGNELTSVSRIVLMLGRIENGGLTGTEWVMNTGATDDQLKEKQKEINWLNLDSRLLSIITSNGRAVVSEPAFVDARLYGADPADVQAEEQLEAAHGFAHEMTTAK